jgi:hypothetical protein
MACDFTLVPLVDKGIDDWGSKNADDVISLGSS